MKTFTVEIDGSRMTIVRDDDGKFIIPEGWRGVGTALKPAWEPIVLARKPLSEGTVAANVLKHGTGALNIDAGRVAVADDEPNVRRATGNNGGAESMFGVGNSTRPATLAIGRWPANLAHDGSPEVKAAFGRFGDAGGANGSQRAVGSDRPIHDGGFADRAGHDRSDFGDGKGTAARFFFCGKAQPWEREGSHPTVKPVALMEWLVSLVTPPGGKVLDPFCGTGSTLVACDWLGFNAIGIEQDAQICRDAEAKIKRLRARRMLGEVERHEPLPGQLGLF